MSRPPIMRGSTIFRVDQQSTNSIEIGVNGSDNRFYPLLTVMRADSGDMEDDAWWDIVDDFAKMLQTVLDRPTVDALQSVQTDDPPDP